MFLDPLDFFAKVYAKESPSEAMRWLCAKLLEKYADSEPPIGLKPIIENLDVAIERKSSIKKNGMLRFDKDRFTILLPNRSKSNWRRDRFTVAHELGHVLLVKTLQREPGVSNLLFHANFYAQIERICDLCASEVLIPANDFKLQIGQDYHRTFTSQKLRYLYDRYLVNYLPILLKFLNYETDAIVFWRKNTTLEKAEWRVSASYSNDRIYIPRQITAEKHLFPNSLDVLSEERPEIFSEKIELMFSKRVIHGSALFLLFPRMEDRPLFEGFLVPDEERRNFDAVMLFRSNRV
jgi:Zn-dependent peptidase ImmA (M78 family)